MKIKTLIDNYKSTLNLPETKFPMRADLTKHEVKRLSHWINNDLYGKIRAARKGKKLFIVHDGPPYANGSIHIGHAVNKILKDIVVKSKILSGFDSPYIPGWDCHGLPIELKVEQKYGKPGEKYTAAEFRTKCREYAMTQVNDQRKDFIRLGVLGDWEKPYLTMDFITEANIIRALGTTIKNGFLKRGEKPIHWCLDCRSVLADAEIEYHSKISASLYVMFKAVNQELIKSIFNCPDHIKIISLLIWTTTPWTLPSNRAICLSPKYDYSLVKVENQGLILAKDLVENVMKRLKIKDYALLCSINSADLEFLRFKHPFLDFDIPIILGEYVNLDIGTGAVHVAGGHGPDDYNISKKYNLEIVNSIGENGVYVPNTHPLLDGIKASKADNLIINILRNSNTLFYIEKIKHQYPCCWRHKTPTIFRSTPQWFITMDTDKSRCQALNKVKNVRWIPNWGKERIESMIINRPDWCISRQRTWGVPMSLFVNKATQELHPNTLELIEKIAKYVEIKGIQAWWDINPNEILDKDSDLYEKVLDTLDVWFDSGSTHTSVVDVRPEFSGNCADMYLEGSDQHRGWFMSSLITSVAMKHHTPYRIVLTHGFVVDNKGRKMSKSAGNSISPNYIINNMGADILRLWVASTDYTGEMALSDEILKNTSDIYRRIRNTIRFLIANLNDFDPLRDTVKLENMVSIDRWAIICLKLTQRDIINFYETYNFHKIVHRLMHFCSIDMGSCYFEIIKDRQYTTKKDSIARRSCQTTMYYIAEVIVRWLAPIISFTADEIWKYLPGKREKYVFTSEWYEKSFELDQKELKNFEFWNEIFKVRNEVNKIIERARNDKKIGNALELSVILYAEPNLKKKLISLGAELRFVLLTSSVKVLDYVDATIDAEESEFLKGLKIFLGKAQGKKCRRCWHYSVETNTTSVFLDICKRCLKNIEGKGETRKFA